MPLFPIVRQTHSAIPGVLLAAVLAVSGCVAGEMPSTQQMNKEDQTSRLQQMLRVAATTAKGGDLASAARLYRRAHATDTQAAEPLVGLAETAARMGAYEEAELAYAQAAERAPDHAGVRLGLGKILLVLDRPERAAEQFRAAIRITPTDKRGYGGLGVALDMSGRHADAQAAYRSGLEHAPFDLALTNNLGLSLALEGQFDAAIETLRRIANMPNANARNRLNLALAHGLAGDDKKAAEIASMDLKPADVKRNLAYYARLRGLGAGERASRVLGASPPVPSPEAPAALAP